MRPPSNRFQSDHQSFFQLASIQSASLGYSVIIIGKQLAIEYGPGTAICSIVVANLLLWLVAIAIIFMVNRVHANAIENIKSYIGKYGGFLAAAVLLCAFMNWYAFQINFTMDEVASLVQMDTTSQRDLLIRFGAASGLFTALLAIGGIRLLRKLSVISLPILFIYILYSMWSSNQFVRLQGTWGLSFAAVLTSTVLLLPGVINFPTFFRHSRSKAHSLLALTILTVIISFFEIATIWMDFSFSIGAISFPLLTFLVLFLILLVTLCNLLNIYLASACWEAIVPHFIGGKEYAIIGLFGTLTYTFVQISTPVLFLQDLTNAYLAVLGIVLMLAYLMRLIIRHRPRPHEIKISLTAWLFGCCVATIYEMQHFLKGEQALLAGINASIVYFLCVIFIEETVWAMRKKFSEKMKLASRESRKN